MPAPSKMISLFLAPAALVRALPLLHTLSRGDIQLFANAFLGSATGGSYNTCDAIETQLGLTRNLGLDITTSRTQAFNEWAADQCVSANQDAQLCAEVSAYLSATYYAYEAGWIGTHLFAVLGGEFGFLGMSPLKS